MALALAHSHPFSSKEPLCPLSLSPSLGRQWQSVKISILTQVVARALRQSVVRSLGFLGVESPSGLYVCVCSAACPAPRTWPAVASTLVGSGERWPAKQAGAWWRQRGGLEPSPSPRPGHQTSSARSPMDTAHSPHPTHPPRCRSCALHLAHFLRAFAARRALRRAVATSLSGFGRLGGALPLMASRSVVRACCTSSSF